MTEPIVSSNNRNGKKVMRTIIQAITESIFYAPLLLTIGIYIFTPAAMIGWLIGLIVAYTLPQLLLKEGKQYKNYTRVAYIFVNVLILLVLLYSSFQGQYKVVSIIVWLIATVFFIHSGIRNFMYSWRGSFTAMHMVYGIIACIALQILKILVLTKIASYNGLFYGCGMIALIIFLYIINERMLGERRIVDEASRAFRMSVRINRILITMIAVVLLALALLRGIQQQIEDWVMNVIRKLIAWLSSFESSEVVEENTPSPPAIDMGEALPKDEPSPFWTYLEQILKYLVIAVVVVAIGFIIVYSSKLIIKGIKKLIARLFNRYQLGAEPDDGYIDEIEELQPIAKRAKLSNRMKQKNSQMNTQNWSKLSNTDKARVLYKHVVKKKIDSGFHYQASHTAKQIIEAVQVQPQSKLRSQQPEHRIEDHKADYDQLLDVYNDARYGEKTANESSLQKLYEKFIAKKQT